MGSKGSQQKTEQTSTATSAPNAQAGALYGDILTRLGNYADQNPNAPVYQGERVAQFTPDQLSAMGTVNQAQGAYQPYMQQAGQFAQQAGSAITPDQINAAMNPYQQQVIDATMAQMSQKNAQQMSALKGTEAQQGAFGGSRAAVTEANLGGQQNMNMASTLAGLNNQNYNQAVAQAQANRTAAGTGAQLQSGLGTQSMQLPFMGAQQQAQQGALQQRLAQQNLDVPYQNFLQQQAYTPQMLQFMASLGTGVGSQMGGTTTNTGQTTNTPAQSSNLGSMLGAGLALASIPLTGGASAAYAIPAAAGAVGSMKNAGGRINKADGGSVGSDIVGNAVRMARQMREGMAGGGVPGAGVGTSEYMGHNIPAIFPTSQMAMGKGAPSTPGFVSSPEMKDPNAGLKKEVGSSLVTLAKAGYDKWNESPMDISTPAQGAYTPMAVGDISSGTIGGTGLSGFGGVYSLGGTVSPESAYHGFAHRAYGGSLFDPTPISEQGGEDPNNAPVMPPEGFMDQPPSIVPAGEFKPYEAPPQAPVPMPRPRPESLRVNDLAAAAPVPIGAAAVPMPRALPVQPAAPPTGGIFTRLLKTESNGRQLDKDGNPLMSPKGATGIAQIMPTTGPEAAKLAGLPWDEQKFKYDAKYNAALGKAYFDHQTKVFGGDAEKGAAAYNAGPGRLREAMAMAAAHGGSYKDYLPAETQNYLGKIFGQPQAGLGEPANGGPQAFSGDTRQDILAKYVKNPIEVRGEPEQRGLALPFAQGDGGDGTGGDGSGDGGDGSDGTGGDGSDGTGGAGGSGIVKRMARTAAEGATTPTQLAQNASILERLTGIQLSDAGRQALMAAGLRMMTTPGNIGTVLGTAGMQGMATYSEAKNLERAQIEAQRKQAFEEKKLLLPYEQMTAQQKAESGLKPYRIGADGKLEPTPGGPADPATVRSLAEAKVPPSSMSPQSLEVSADVYRMTGRLPPNMGRGIQGSQEAAVIRNRAAEKEQDAGGDPADWADRWQQFGTRATGLRTFETRAAGLTLAENEARALVPRVRELLGTVDRTRFPDLNKLIIAGQTKTGNENEIKLGIAINSLIPVYARVLKPVGQVGQTDMANAQHLLEQKWSTGQMGAALDQFEVELHAAKDALAKARKEYGSSGPALPGRSEKKEEVPAKPATPSGAENQPPAKPAAPPAAGATLPPDIPPGSKLIGTSTDGKKVYEAPNGKRYTSE